MKKPEIVYCNIIRKDDKQGEVAISARDINEMIDALIDGHLFISQLIESGIGDTDSVKHTKNKLEKALEKSGVEL